MLRTLRIGWDLNKGLFMKKLAIGLLFSMVSVSAFANTPNFKTLADEKATFELCESAAKTLNNQDLQVAPFLNLVKPYLGVSEDDMEGTLLANQFVLDHFKTVGIGNPVETIHIDTEKSMKDTFLTHEFLLKRELYAFGMHCKFYQSRPNSYWKMANFSIHTL